MRNNTDYLIFSSIVILAFLVTSFYMHRSLSSKDLKLGKEVTRRTVMGFVHFSVSIIMIIILVFGNSYVNNEETHELEHLRETYGGIARNFAFEVQKMGHQNIGLNTSASDPVYTKLVDKMVQWMKINPDVDSIYSMRKVDRLNRFIVAPETDYDHNGVINGEQEARVPIGEVYDEHIEELEQAFKGSVAVQKYPTSDKWGYTISVFVPVYSSAGKVEAVLGVDFDGIPWDKHIRVTRLKAMGILLAPLLMLYLTYITVFVLRVHEIKNIKLILFHDSLTGLPNRAMFNKTLTQELADARERNENLCVMFIDLDNFKNINDTFGHSTGDYLLRSVAERLKHSIREGDLLARWGGDEFTLLVPRVKNQEMIKVIANKICSSLKKPIVIDGRELYIATSVGISKYPAHGGSAEILIKNADTAMYRSKEQGGNCYKFFTPSMNAKAVQRHNLENDLRRAIYSNEFQVFYQPQVNLASREIVGVEALARWDHPQKGLIFPAKFISIAEETGLIDEIDRKVLLTACKNTKHWLSMGHKPIRVAVNLSARHFKNNNVLETFISILKHSKIEPRYLELEITESIAMNTNKKVINVLTDLRALGITIALDDFGTGYSSICYLKQLPINRLKIDQSFTGSILQRHEDAAIVKGIIAMAHSLNIDVIAEGVENRQQLKCLYDMECDEVQGSLFSNPLPAHEIEKIFAEDGFLRRVI